MRNQEREGRIRNQIDILTDQVQTLRQYVRDNGKGVWQDVVPSELSCILVRLELINRENNGAIKEKAG